MTDQELLRWQLGFRIKMRRIRTGISQSELAKRVGYSGESGKTMISKIESGKTEPPFSKLPEFAKALNTSVSYLMGWEENSNDVELTAEDKLLVSAWKKADKQTKRIVAFALKDYGMIMPENGGEA